MEMTLAVLVRQLGGSPNETFISRIENGKQPSMVTAAKLAEALELPVNDVLNASGFATHTQILDATDRLRALVHSPAPVAVALTVLDERTGSYAGTRQRMMPSHDPAFIVDLTDPAGEPFVGEVTVQERKVAAPGQGTVVQRLDGSLYATKDPLDIAVGEKPLGAIIRVVRTTDF
jgi:DNA-binding XRE family transcriptional regulator